LPEVTSTFEDLLKTIKKETAISQSLKLFPILYEARYFSIETIITYPTAMHQKLAFVRESVGNNTFCVKQFIRTYKSIKLCN